MFILSEDQSAHAQFKALIAQLEKEAADAKHARDKCRPRTQEYHYHNGAMGAYNSTISLLMTTDIMRNAPQPVYSQHAHLTMPDGVERIGSIEDQTKYLEQAGYATDDIFKLLARGIKVSLCTNVDCMAFEVPQDMLTKYTQVHQCVCAHTLASHTMLRGLHGSVTGCMRCACYGFKVSPEDVVWPEQQEPAED